MLSRAGAYLGRTRAVEGGGRAPAAERAGAAQRRTDITALSLRYVAGIGPNTSVWPPGEVPMPPQSRTGRGRPQTRLQRGEHQPISVKMAEILGFATTMPAAISPGPPWNSARPKELDATSEKTGKDARVEIPASRRGTGAPPRKRARLGERESQRDQKAASCHRLLMPDDPDEQGREHSVTLGAPTHPRTDGEYRRPNTA